MRTFVGAIPEGKSYLRDYESGSKNRIIKIKLIETLKYKER
jgi:hypothetical protein